MDVKIKVPKANVRHKQVKPIRECPKCKVLQLLGEVTTDI